MEKNPREKPQEQNPDLFYRLKLKLWNRYDQFSCSSYHWKRTSRIQFDLICAFTHRDPISNKIRNPYSNEESTSFWTAGTRVVISEEGDFAFGRCGRIIEPRFHAFCASSMLCYDLLMTNLFKLSEAMGGMQFGLKRKGIWYAILHFRYLLSAFQ